VLLLLPPLVVAVVVMVAVRVYVCVPVCVYVVPSSHSSLLHHHLLLLLLWGDFSFYRGKGSTQRKGKQDLGSGGSPLFFLE
jgi:hypothetical protein